MSLGVLVVKSGRGELVATSVDVSNDIITPYHLVADGGDVTQGALSDAAWGGTGDGSVVAVLKAVFGRLPANPATDASLATVIAGLTSIDGHVDGLEALTASVLAKLSADPATQTTLAAVLAKLGDGTAKTISANPATVYAGQQAVTATAAALPARALVNGLVVTASPLNAATVFIGAGNVNSTNTGAGTGYPLSPGQSASFGATDASAIFVIAAATGSFVSFFGN